MSLGELMTDMQRSMRVLVVEDNPADAFLATEQLAENKDIRFEVAHVAALKDAVEWLAKSACDAIILDLGLPDSQGLATLHTARDLLQIPTVVMSSAIDEHIREAALNLGAQEVLSKDYLNSRLLTLSVLYVIERNRAQEQQRQLQKILDTNPDAVLVVDPRGAVKFVNAAAMRFFGRSRVELMQEPLIFAGGAEGATEIRVSRPGIERVGELRLVDLEWEGEPALLASIRDVTQQRELEMRLLMSDRLVSLGTLAAGVAHEINNPLSALTANLGLAVGEVSRLARGSDLHSELLEELEDSRDAAERIRVIVRDLKGFSRTKEDTAEAQDIHRILDSVVRMAGSEVRSVARLVKDYGDVPPVFVNECRINQVFLNLVVNAAHAIEPGMAEKNEIRIRTRQSYDGRILVEISDTGGGIPPHVQDRLFTPFFTTKPAGVGTGLGLAICQQILTEQGGEIYFETEQGKGTTFSVALPAADSVALTIPAPPPQMENEAAARARVLVIDDDPLIVKTIRRMLGRTHDVTCLTRATAALELLHQGDRFDLILCDLMMPQMNGMEFFRVLGATLPACSERVVFLTGGAFTSDAREFLERVPNQRLEKPFDPTALRILVESMLRQAAPLCGAPLAESRSAE